MPLHRYFSLFVLAIMCLLCIAVSYTLRNAGIWPGDYINSAKTVSQLEGSYHFFLGPAQLQRLASYQLGQGNLVKAKTLALSSLKHDPGNARAIITLNMVQLQQGEADHLAELFMLGKRAWPALYYQYMLTILDDKFKLMLDTEIGLLRQKYKDDRQLREKMAEAKEDIAAQKQRGILNLKREMLDAQKMD